MNAINHTREDIMFRSAAVTMLIAAMLISPNAFAGDTGFEYTAAIKEPVPIPPSEVSLQTVTAETYFKVSDKSLQLEGPAFDRDGNLLFVEVFGGRVYRLTGDKKLTELLGENKRSSAGIAIHKDGRIFVAGLGNFKDKGSVFTVENGAVQDILPEDRGYMVDDLVFDDEGGFYFTDFRGSSTDAAGGVFYVTPDFKEVTPIIPHLAVGNGIGLSPDGKTLWVTEFGRNLLHRVALSAPGKVAPFGTSIPYQFTGPAPDSLRLDADGNVYVAMYEQGRVLVFNPSGVPIGQALLPRREKGHHLKSTAVAIKPGTKELYIVANDGAGNEGSTIFRVGAFAEAPIMYSHR
jgi:lactonase